MEQATNGTGPKAWPAPMQSESIAKLAEALSKAQAAIKAPKKGKTATVSSERTGKAYSYSYADLADVIDCYRVPLSENGLAITQTMRIDGGHIVLVTTLMHSSGEWKASEYPLAIFNRPQEQGSAITYARRYAVTAFLDIAAEEDDDGQAAQDATSKTPAKRPEPQKPTTGSAQTITREEIESVHMLAKKAGYRSPAELAPVLTNICGVSKASEIPKKELAGVLESLMTIADNRAAEASA